jgi:hypothetical protein
MNDTVHSVVECRVIVIDGARRQKILYKWFINEVGSSGNGRITAGNAGDVAKTLNRRNKPIVSISNRLSLVCLLDYC